MPTLGAIAAELGIEFRGDPQRPLETIASLEQAGGDALSFVASRKYASQLGGCAAGALIIDPAWLAFWAGDCLLSANPYLDYARATRLFDSRPLPSGEVHPSAVVDPSVVLGASVTVDAGAVVGADVVLGDHVWIGANCVLDDGVRIGSNTRIYPGAVVYHRVVIGEHCTVHANAVIGADGFGFAPAGDRWEKILQLGTVRIGNFVEIGACSTVDRGALDDTVLEDGVLVDDQVHIGHGVHVGAMTAMAAGVGISGSTRIGKRCTVAGQAGFAGHIEIADDVNIGGQGRVSASVTEPGHYVSGTSLQPFGRWSRNVLRFEQLDDMAKRLKALEKQLQALADRNSRTGE